MEEAVGIREVKKLLSRYIREVKKGKTITITDRGVPVARLSPVQSTMPQGTLAMVEEGLASWQGDKPGLIQPVRTTGVPGKTLAEMVSEDRR